ncbi:MAG: SGNH/GDSL hydrolase family protein [Leptospiraceae bacterium]|nr:SGNH/GDSL hydrolase family protein [Leptospiraceae bacterium]MCP5494718.1 SGNH/GDSL hydrolase family protein [Leptospiraceae bacterium]
MDPSFLAQAILKDISEKPIIKKMHKKNKAKTLAKWMIESKRKPYTGGFPAYRLQEQSLEIFRNNILNYKSKSTERNVSIAFGDSLIAFIAKNLTQVDYRLNFAQPGSGSPNFLKTAKDLSAELQDFNIKNVVVGCFGGNPLLSYQDFEEIKQEASLAFHGLRAMFPDAKIIVYGLPPVYDVYANIFAIEFEKFMIQEVKEDKNAVFLLLRLKFSDKSGLLPTIKYSSDGVHLRGNAIPILDKMISEAKTLPPGTVLY